ncbi:MAG: hypothetical protein WBV22_02190 [Anaerolineaceae bacterium]
MRRHLLVPVLLFGVILVIFFILQFLTLSDHADLYIRDIPKNPNAIEGAIRRYGLDKPLPVQYWNWLVGIKDPNQPGAILGEPPIIS